MRRLVGVGVLLCSLVGPAWGQFAVLEAPGPLLTETIMGTFQQTLNTIESVIHTANWVEDLVGFESSALPGYTGALEELAAFISEAQTFWESEDLRWALGINGAVDNSWDLAERLDTLRRLQQWRYWYALRAQRFTAKTADVVNRLLRMLERVLPARGDKQILQNLNEYAGQLGQIQTQQSALVAAYQAAAMTEPMQNHWVEQSMVLINQNLLVDWVR